LIAPSHLRPHWSPGEVFTNRHRAKAQFQAALDTPQGLNQYRVLNWFGVGGQGKTALLEEFERNLAARNKIARDLWTKRAAYALIDFEVPKNRDIATALLSLRDKLAQTGGLHCPTFEIALLRYFLLTEPGAKREDLKARYFHTGSEALDDVLQLLQTAGEFGQHVVPGFGLLSKYGSRLAGKAAHSLHTWWTKRGLRAFVDIDSLSQDALLRRLPSYLGADLMDALDGKHPPRIVIMFDTYEALWRGRALGEGVGALRVDDWVRHLVQDSQGVLFVVAGRDKLRWAEIDKDWAAHIEPHLLGGLTRPDSDALLSKLAVAEPELRRRMIEGARNREYGEVDPSDESVEAYLVFYLTLQGETYHDIKTGGKTPRPEDFGGEHPQILARFLDHLDPEADRLLRVASYLSTLDVESLDWLADRFLGGRAQARWTSIFERSLVSDEKDGVRSLHDLLRQALQERERRERPKLFEEIHREMFRWNAERCEGADGAAITSGRERAFLAALRHLARVDEREAVRWAIRQMQLFSAAARWRILEEACLIVAPMAERAFGGENEWTTANLSWLARVYSATGRYADAEALHERVKAIEEKALGTQHPDYAATLANLAGVYSATGRYADAEALYERVKAIEEKALGTEHPSYASTLANLAGVYSATGRYAEAEALYERVKAIEEKALGTQHPSYTTTLHELARVYSDTGRYADAEALYEQAKAIYEKALGTQHPSYAATLANLAGVYSDTRRYADSKALYEQAKAIYEKALGMEHPYRAVVMVRLARLCLETGDYVASRCHLERAQEIYSAKLPANHPRMAGLLVARGLLNARTDQKTQAAQDFRDAIAILGAAGVRPEQRDMREARVGLARLSEENAV
jgi:tetratricopeptide (TPR) repeat protein